MATIYRISKRTETVVDYKGYAMCLKTRDVFNPMLHRIRKKKAYHQWNLLAY